jgi:uncharacterized membrane protein
MNKINWKSKLTSRKFWAAVIGFVTALLTAFAVPVSTVTQVTAIIMAGATLIAYIIGEGMVDAASAGTQIVMPDAATIIGTIPDTAAPVSSATGTEQAEQTQQVTSGLAAK